MGSKMDDAIDAAVAGSERRRARQATATATKKKKKKKSTSIIKEGIKSIRQGHKRTKDAADKY
tara:strand:- start:312 stop:500 length:189 start_codon:yes stop_codon:yes gene_type:complete